MAGWTTWQDLEKEVLNEDDTVKEPGVYQVRIVNSRGEPIPIPRLGGTDTEAVYYIGQSSDKVRNRLKTFESGRPGGEVLDNVSEKLEEKPDFARYRLEYRIRAIAKRNPMTPEAFEELLLSEYLYSFCELLPGNNNMPRKAMGPLLERVG